MTDLPAIMGRLRAATGPDRTLDADICVALGYVPGVTEPVLSLQWGATDPEWDDDGDLLYEVIEDGKPSPWASPLPALTSSIDAAVALVERMLPGWGWAVDKLASDVYGRDIGAVYFADGMFQTRAATPALAILIATLQALIEREGT